MTLPRTRQRMVKGVCAGIMKRERGRVFYGKEERYQGVQRNVFKLLGKELN